MVLFRYFSYIVTFNNSILQVVNILYIQSFHFIILIFLVVIFEVSQFEIFP